MARPPDPTPIRVLKGRGDGKDSRGYAVPKPPEFERGIPECPDHLNDDARELWMRVTPGLDRLDLLKPEDWQALVTYCELWAVYRQAYRQVQSRGLVTKHPKTGMLHKNPAMGVVETVVPQLLRLAQQFGLTPASESALSRGAVLTSDDDDKFAASG